MELMCMDIGLLGIWPYGYCDRRKCSARGDYSVQGSSRPIDISLQAEWATAAVLFNAYTGVGGFGKLEPRLCL